MTYRYLELVQKVTLGRYNFIIIVYVYKTEQQQKQQTHQQKHVLSLLEYAALALCSGLLANI
jgi:hypothetical protein